MMDDDNEPPPTPPNQIKKTYIFVICLFFVLLAFTLLYFLRRHGFLCPSSATTTHATTPPTRVPRGMDASDIASLPSLRFSEIKTHWAKKPDHTQLECVVCLNEFSDQENLRILPHCLHVYHPNCIATWLSKHATCPVCRASLEHSKGTTASLSSILERFDDHDDEVHLTLEIEGRSRLDDGDSMDDLNGGRLRRSFSTGDLDVRIIVGRSSQVTGLLGTLSKEICLLGGFRSITP